MRRGVSVAAVAFLLALLVVSGIVGAFYYSQYNAQVATSRQYLKDLQAVDSEFNETATNYDILLNQYNLSVSLLSKSVAQLNTSSPVYAQASTELAALWKTYLDLRPEKTSLYSAGVVIDFENGTKTWYNNTSVQPGWNLYVLTVVLTSGRVDSQWYPQYGEHFVTGVEGVTNNPALNRAWFFWDLNASKWQNPPVGADDLNVYNGSYFAWTYCSYDPSTFAPKCAPP
jgi:hypothetical protein